MSNPEPLMKRRFRTTFVASVKIGASRQVVIPKEVHDDLGLAPGDCLEVELQDGRVVMTRKSSGGKTRRGSVSVGEWDP